MTDRRIERTNQLLADALVALILEKGYEAVTIKDITERANVAYVTFFRHYKEKDELLDTMLAGVVEKLSALMEDDPNHVYPHVPRVEEGYHIFQHVYENNRLYRILLGSQGAARIVRRVRDAIATQILRKCEPLRATPGAIPLEIQVNHIASSLLALIEWWLDNDMPYPPERMAEMYDALVVQAAWNTAFGVRIQTPPSDGGVRLSGQPI